jgi:hypothetical protein
MEIRCFLLEPTGRTVRHLRRYVGVAHGLPKCPGQHGYHDARAFLDVLATPQDQNPGGETDWPKDDPRWPVKCDYCDHVFGDQAFWFLDTQHEMRRADTGQLTTLHDAEAGAMWWADWLTGHFASIQHRGRGDGPHLVVRTPGGDWDIDVPASNRSDGSGWDRSGSPPDVVARPSILISGVRDYHGFLGGSAGDRPGYLVQV